MPSQARCCGSEPRRRAAPLFRPKRSMVPAAAHRTQRRLLAAALAAGLVAHSAALQLPLQPRSWLLQPPEEAAAAGASPSLGTTAAAAAAGARGSSVPAAADADAAQQCFSWSWTHSIAGGTFAYPPNDAQGDENAASRLAQAGDVIALQCDSVICPNPLTRSCYMDDENACADDEWCRLEDHIKFGPFGMVHGETPNNIAYETCAELQRGGFSELFEQVCGGQSNWGPWFAVRGRCEKYRGEEESCNAQMATGAFGPQYVTGTDGRPPRAALVCGPGLACTGNFGPLPHTCVKARPPNTCFQGPWWDSSSWCKVGGADANNFTRGLPRKELERIAPALLLQLPTELFHNPEVLGFWQSQVADRGRASIAAIVQELWPEKYRRDTRFPLETFPDPRLQGTAFTREWNATAAEAHVLYRQSNKVWSLIHTLMANTADPMRPASVEASRALAVWLRQHFMCTNCRGFWGNLVVNEMGLPPDSTSREVHVRWWYDAHNAVSEHSAATRGGHPYLYPRMPRDAFQQRFGSLSPQLTCQNAFFMPFEHVRSMWTIPEEEDGGSDSGGDGSGAGRTGAGERS